LNTCLFNTYTSTFNSNPKDLQYLNHQASIQPFHHLIYSYIGSSSFLIGCNSSSQLQNSKKSHVTILNSSQRVLPLDLSVQDQMNWLIPSREQDKTSLSRNDHMSHLFKTILIMKLHHELESYIIININYICNFKSSHISNRLYARVSNLLENLQLGKTQASIMSSSLQNLDSQRLSKSFIQAQKLFRIYSIDNKSLLILENPSLSSDEDEFNPTKKEDLSEDLNEAASTTSGYSREGDICIWSLTAPNATELEKPAHDASGNYLFPADDENLFLRGAMSCYDGFFVGNLEMNFDSCDQYLSLPMKQIPGKGTSQKQTPKEIVVEKKSVGQIKTNSMFSSPVIQSKTRFDFKESYSNPSTPQYIPQNYQRRSPKSNFQKIYGQSEEKKPQLIEGSFVNDKFNKYGKNKSIHTRFKNQLTDSQPNSGFAKRS